MYSTTGRPLRPSSQPTTTSIMDSQTLEHSGLREMKDDDIVDAAMLTFGERRKKFSHVFNLAQAFHKNRGDLLSKYRYLQPRINERKAVLVDHHSLSLPRKETPLRQRESKKRPSKDVEPKLGFEVPDSSAKMEGLSRTLQSSGNLSQDIEPRDPQRSPEQVLCSGETCPKKSWTAADLQAYFGAEIQSVREMQQRHSHWLCILCSFKAHTQPATQAPSLPVPLNSLETLNCDTGWLEDDSIREPLNLLKGAMVQYLSMARRKLSSLTPKFLIRILDVPFIQNETTTRDTAQIPPLTKAMRKLLDVPAAVLIKNKLAEEKLENTDFSIWIRGALAAFVADFIFSDDSPFEDDTLLRKTLIESKLAQCPAAMHLIPTLLTIASAGRTPEHADMTIQAFRIHCAKAFKSPNEAEKPKYLTDRINNQHQSFVELLNNAMMPLVSGDTEVQGHHKRIAMHARDLKLITSTYRGTFEAIGPNFRTPFDPTLYSLENPTSDVDKGDLAGQPILVTTLPGIKFRLPGGEWRVCAEAFVHPWPKCEPATRNAFQIVLHHNSQVSRKRKVGPTSYPEL
jgi:hypothetical protein